MYRVIFVLVPLVFFTTQAEARHRHYHHSRYRAAAIDGFNTR